MAGLTAQTPQPTNIVLHGKSRVLEVAFATGETFNLPFELLRVYSPSAEVQGHGKGQEVLQIGKRLVDIDSIEPVGNYGIKPTFDDGHASGIFSWDYLYELGKEQGELWRTYERRLQEAGASRDRDEGFSPVQQTSCGSGSCGCKS